MDEHRTRAKRRGGAFRRLGWLTIVSLVMTTLGPGTSGVAAADPVEGGSTGGFTIQADAPLQPTLGQMVAGTTNPALPTNVCREGDFGFAIDRSGSIQTAGASTAQKNGIKAFVDAFEAIGSGAYAGTRFGGQTATNITSGFRSAATFKSAVDAMPTPTGRTPTGLAIGTAAANAANDRGTAPNVLFVVTDGSPNVPWSSTNIDRNYPGDPNGWLAGANAAINAANAARSAGWVVLAIYVGAPDSGLPFSASDDQTWVNNVMSRVGGGTFTQIASFNQLADALLVSTGCVTPPGSVRITKTVTGDTAGFGGGQFTFSLDCAAAGSFQGSVTLAAAQLTGSTTISDIPAGASCTVSETARPGAGTDHRWLAPTITPNPVAIVSQQTVEISVGNPRDFVEAPALAIEKTAKTASFNEAGDLLAYEIVATNTGNVTLTNVQVSDPKLGALTCSPALGSSLAPNATMTCTGTYTTVQADVDAGKVDNTATADSAQTEPVDDDATVPAVQGPALGVVKSVTETSFRTGDVLHYTIVATNLGNVTLTNVQVSDPKLGALTCSPALGSSLAPNATMTCTGTYTTVQADVDAGKVDNTATADSAETPPVDDSESVVAARDPALGIDKRVSLDGDSYSSELTATIGQELHYRIVVTNTGNVTLTDLSLADDLYGPLVAESCSVPVTLSVGASFTCEYQAEASTLGTLQNTATADSAETGPVDDTATVTVQAPEPARLVVVKLLDIDGRSTTASDRVPAAGWSFTTAITDGTISATSGTTAADGSVSFDVEVPSDGVTATVDVTEIMKKDFKLMGAYCAVGEVRRGTLRGLTVGVVPIAAGETVTCTFVNTSGDVERETATPRVTPPPTSTEGMPAGDASGNVLLALLAIIGLVAVLGVLTPAPARARRRGRRG